MTPTAEGAGIEISSDSSEMVEVSGTSGDVVGVTELVGATLRAQRGCPLE